MEFRQLRSYIALAECENFTQAANSIYVSQPTVSTHLRLLEDELQTQLVVRDTKKVRLTERGREFYDFAKRVVGLEDQLKQKWLEESGQIHLGASTIPSTYLLPALLPGFLEKNNVHFFISQGDSSAIIEDVRTGLLDLGMVGRITPDADLTFIPFAADRMVLLTASAPRFAGFEKTPPTPETCAALLQTERFINREEGSGTGEAAEKALELLGLNPDNLNVTATASSQETINNLVKNDVGVAIVSNLAAEDAVTSKGLLSIELPVNTHRTFYLVMRKFTHTSPQIRAFAEYLAGLTKTFD